VAAVPIGLAAVALLALGEETRARGLEHISPGRIDPGRA
jgi:hypothetical protein